MLNSVNYVHVKKTIALQSVADLGVLRTAQFRMGGEKIIDGLVIYPSLAQKRWWEGRGAVECHAYFGVGGVNLHWVPGI